METGHQNKLLTTVYWWNSSVLRQYIISFMSFGVSFLGLIYCASLVSAKCLAVISNLLSRVCNNETNVLTNQAFCFKVEQ